MFGYVRPALNRLSEEDRASYQSAYCGLCHAMGRRHGFLTRFTLNYDFAFLAILISGGRGVSGTCAMRCPVHPIRRPQQCLAGAGLDVTADESGLPWPVHALTNRLAPEWSVCGRWRRNALQDWIGLQTRLRAS